MKSFFTIISPLSGVRRLASVVAVLLLLAFIPRAGFATSFSGMTISITTNYPGVSYNVALAEIQRARWGIVGVCAPTNIPGTGWGVGLSGWWGFCYTPQMNFYVPKTDPFNWTGVNFYYTYRYVPYSNTLSVSVSGPVTPVVWTLTGPDELTNSTAYRTAWSGSVDLVAVPTGTYSVAALPGVRGYVTPTATSTNITGASPLVNALNLNYIPYSNSLAVTVSGITSGSNCIWTLTGPAEFANAVSYGTTFTNSFTVAAIPTGLYTVTFPAVVGYTAPATASTNITGASPLVNSMTGSYVSVIWPSATNPPVPPPTNFPAFTNAITLMVDSNGLFKTPSREKIIEANGLLTNGATGTQGPQGEPGLTGAKGDTGAQGPAGTNGADGVAGSQGPAGSNGVDGATGPQGPQGPAGTNGVAGAPGPQGPAGTNGADGATGPVGPQGPHGNNGATGPQGPQGEPGLTGAKGDTGAHGAKGDQGDPGSNGVVGATGPQGPAGTNGSTGAQGPQGVSGSNGVDGAVGPQGPAGSNGVDGATGPQGPAGTNGADGATGPQGPQGPAGTNGVDGAQGPQGLPGTNNITGPQGPAGTNGADGATGPQGPQGPAGTNGVDGATGPAGPAGTNGVDGAIGPQGPAGTNGVDGAVGPQGPAGTNGTDGAQGPAGTNGVDGAVGPQGPAGTNGVDGAVGPQGPAGPVTNQVITYLGIAYTITNDPASTGDILRFNPSTSNAWFAAETWEGISNSVVYTNSPAKACHTPVTLTQTGDTVTITSADSAYQQIMLTSNVTFTFDTSFSTNDSCFVNLALYCNNFPVIFDSNAISAATLTNINLATNAWNSLIFHRGCRQAVWSVR